MKPVDNKGERPIEELRSRAEAMMCLVTAEGEMLYRCRVRDIHIVHFGISVKNPDGSTTTVAENEVASLAHMDEGGAVIFPFNGVDVLTKIEPKVAIRMFADMMEGSGYSFESVYLLRPQCLKMIQEMIPLPEDCPAIDLAEHLVVYLCEEALISPVERMTLNTLTQQILTYEKQKAAGIDEKDLKVGME